MPGWEPPPKRFPHDPAFDGSGPGWHLPEDHATGLPRDYEGRWGSGLWVTIRGRRSWGQVVKVGANGLLIILMLLIVPGMAVFAALRPEELGADDLTPSELLWFALFILLIMSGMLFMGGLGLRVAVRWARELRSGQFLLLTVDDLILTQVRQRIRVPWHALNDVRMYWSKEKSTEEFLFTNELVIRNWLALEVNLDRVPSAAESDPRVDVARLDSDPRLVAALIEFYRDHPEERAELRTVAWQDRAAGIARELPESTS